LSYRLLACDHQEHPMATDDLPLPLPPTPADEHKPHVYVINSSEDFLEMMDDVLSDVELHVTLEQLRPNVEVTLGNLRSARPDLVLLDVVPYRADSLRLLTALSDAGDLKHVPVVLVSTSTAMAGNLANQHAPVVREVLPKPFDLDTFYALLHRLIGVPVP
jgi:CheY-like chemotaxis protein